MNSHLFQSSYLALLMILLSVHFPSSSLAADDENFKNCGQPFQCSNFTDLRYPFWGGNRPKFCGHPRFQLDCQGKPPILTIKSRQYRVLAINDSSADSPFLQVARNEFYDTNCPQDLYNATLDTNYFNYVTDTEDLTLYYGCQTLPGVSALVPTQFNCTVSGSTTPSPNYFLPTGMPINTSCNSIVNVRVNQTAAQSLTNSSNLRQVLEIGFGLQWEANNTSCSKCVGTSGVCGSDSTSGSFVCYCVDGPHPVSCNTTGPTGNEKRDGSGSDSMSMQIGLPIAGAVIAGIGLGWAIFACRQKRKRVAAESAQAAESKDIVSSAPLTKGLTTTPSTNLSHSIPSYRSSKSEFGKASTYFGAQIFSYAELEEATNYFDPSRELGDGGFGTVYYGKLQDGRIVAVKRLYENNFKRVEQFMNEVEILTRLRHVNLVTLYGCTSKRSRELLLVYEFIPNGTVADHLHGRKSNSGLLSWPVRLGIAMETAEALAYLHASDIIHRDVKTNNILLDNDFHVKVADFGLSRLFPNDVTHVSTAPQGTPGYVDPEYYQCYQLTERSDVYSFGVVLIELISSKQAVDTNRDRQEINLANMAINKIQNHTLNELVDPDLGFETNSSVRRMATLVAELAFRCLQMERDMRPSMEEVLKALKRIKNEEMNGGQDAEVVDIVIEDDVGLLKGNPPPLSPDSTATDKRVSNSYTSFSSG
ncbi:LEAF RUST 10 DISEASE-RESISTANCE LOCUS RECEPTOR-LIKE PROTEIN KINASE-like 1.3 isoform X1 [Diospyros lotus]|uniref:LEAF RUST 10 DISEASE-RESISTANCE LOCUS RECEPTOR-LIKE PROTEIN KINASE-like 1.3 isoform X1 n=1 Tax=Diospyros lotus TaxID=55363 RepID=UPI002250DF45|nr:LEAF RUST 10 DISEASE-RESISTANCE LOCUS RECEPTOR-LIKE PROTEIN KINASE-like 1.3 isoform X1 [Diospyros lotus]